MSDQVAQPVSGQAAGTAPAPASSPMQSQTAVPQGQEQTSQNETVEAKPVTAQDLQALEERIAKQIQSQVDKRDARVNKRLTEIDDAVKVLRASGREITDADVQTMKQAAAAKAMTEPEQEPIVQQTADPLDAAQWDPTDPVTRKIVELQLQYGRKITSNMPEAAKIVRGKGALDFVKSYEDALKAITSTPPQATEPKPTVPPAARIPAGSNVPPAPNMTGRGYLKQAGRGG